MPDKEFRGIPVDRRKVVSLGVTGILGTAVLTTAQQSVALEANLDGPESIKHQEWITFVATIDVENGDTVPIERLELTIRPANSEEEVTVTFAPDGTITEIDPEEGVIGAGMIRIGVLENCIEIEPAPDNHPDTGYGYGYGYGYGDERLFKYFIRISGKVFKASEFEAQLTVAGSDGESTTSGVVPFEVTVPGRRDGRPDDPGRDEKGVKGPDRNEKGTKGPGRDEEGAKGDEEC